MTATDAPSDALVLFGATGDLAKKKIFPAVYNMTKADHDHVPVVGFASSEWDDDRLRQHAREAIEAKGDVDEAAWEDLVKRVSYVRGDYRDPGILRAARRAAPWARGAAAALLPRRPSRALRRRDPGAGGTAPPRGSPRRRREAVRPRPRVGPGAQRDRPPSLPRVVGVPHRPLPRQGVGGEPARLPLRQLAPRTRVEPELHLERADHHGGGVRRGGPRPLLRIGRRPARRRPEPPPAGGRAARHGTARRRRRHGLARRAQQAVPPGPHRGAGGGGARPVPRLPGGGRRRRRVRRRDLRRAPARDRLLAMGRCAVPHPHRQAPAGHVDRGGGGVPARRRACSSRRPAPPFRTRTTFASGSAQGTG